MVFRVITNAEHGLSIMTGNFAWAIVRIECKISQAELNHFLRNGPRMALHESISYIDDNSICTVVVQRIM